MISTGSVDFVVDGVVDVAVSVFCSFIGDGVVLVVGVADVALGVVGIMVYIVDVAHFWC